MALIKGLFPGALLAFIVAAVLHHGGTDGGPLRVFEAQVQGHSFYWSWPLFIGGSALWATIFKIME